MKRLLLTILLLPPAVLFAGQVAQIGIIGPIAPKVTVSGSVNTPQIAVIGTKPLELKVYMPTATTANVVIPGIPGPPGKDGASGASNWNQIEGKPDTFPPAAHNQAISTVNGLQSALDGKQPAGSYQPAGDYATNGRLNNYSVAVAQKLAGKEPTGVASSLVASHNMDGSAHSGQFVAAGDPRLSDRRIPIEHVSTHFSGGTDPLTPANIGAAPAGDYATNGRLDNYSAAMAAQMATKATLRQQATFSRTSSPVVYVTNLRSTNTTGNMNYGYATPELTGLSSQKNVFLGHGAGSFFVDANNVNHTTLVGFNAGTPGTGASFMTVVGSDAMGNYLGTGNAYITAVGSNAGSYLMSGGNYYYGKYNTYIGSEVKPAADNTYYEMALGHNAVGKGSYSTVIGSTNTSNTYIYGNLSTGRGKTLKKYDDHVASVGTSHPATAISGLATVATTGSYPDLFNKPTIPIACGADPATAIFDGAPGAPALFCNITGGRRNVVFDASGRNPTGMSPFSALLYEGSNLVTPMYWSWFTGGASNAIYGTGLSSSFTPTVRASFSIYSSQNNYVGAYLTYSSIYGKRAARCYAAVAVSKIGDAGLKGDTGNTGAAATIAVGTVTTGAAGTNAIVTNGGSSSAAVFNFTIPKGDTGDPGTITQDQVLTKVKEVSTAVLERSSSSAGSVMIQVKDATASHNVRFFVTDTGLIYTKDEYGKVRWGFDEPNKKFIMGNYSNGSIRRNYEVDTYGQEKRFATDGKTVIYQSYTTGREKWFSTAGKLQRHKFPDGKIITYRPDGITPAFTNRTSAALVIGG